MLFNNNYNAITQIKGIFENLFTAANFQNGDVLTNTQIKNATSPLFYHITAKSTDAIQQPLYLIYRLESLERTDTGYIYNIYFSIYSREEKAILQALQQIEKLAKYSQVDISFSFYNYDIEQKVYNYDLKAQGVVFTYDNN